MKVVYFCYFIALISSRLLWEQSDIEGNYYISDNKLNGLYFGKHEEFMNIDTSKNTIYLGHWYRLDFNNLLVGSKYEKDHSIPFNFTNKDSIKYNNIPYQRDNQPSNIILLFSMLGYHNYKIAANNTGDSNIAKLNFMENTLTIFFNNSMPPLNGAWNVISFNSTIINGILVNEKDSNLKYQFQIQYKDMSHILFNNFLFDKAN
ncbi:hypothetical protein K502DRAFT_331630 [Neoconidiobolus thromboides FSU 785]|nr:hypothetical protein K502DRAFT_331630 [Neoconidiobolus thromboides FSU 785]